MRVMTIRAILTTFLLALSSVVSGCATIVHLGGNEELNVSSEPAGAKSSSMGRNEASRP